MKWNRVTKEMNNVADGMGIDEWRMKWNSGTQEMNNVADGIGMDGVRMNQNSWTKEMNNVANGMGMDGVDGWMDGIMEHRKGKMWQMERELIEGE